MATFNSLVKKELSVFDGGKQANRSQPIVWELKT